MARRCLVRVRAAGSVGGFVLILRDFDERHDVGVDDLERRLGPQLAAQQPDRFLVRVHVLGSASHKAGDQHALKRRDVELRLNGRFDRDFEIVGAARQGDGRASGRQQGEREATTCLSLDSSGH